ncbi:MAG: tRNA dihydrouridine synthase DusB [Clostridia bacterium]|nr:tRNA dihydrouridine synthase DusB [Clostridia bacterium]
MKIGFSLGNVRIENGLVLAPMAGVTDRAFRALSVSMGAGMTVSEMISAKAIWYKDKKTALLSEFSPEEEPFSIQLFGSEPEIMAHAAAELEGRYPTLAAIDINMGCPMPKITGNGEGSSLMRSPELAGRIVKAVKDAVNLPVSVKMRTGWDETCLNAPYLAQVVEQSGADLICVHGRTRKQLYAPPVDKKTIAAVKRSVSVPVLANGGIYTAADAISMLEETGCDGLAIGQGAMGNPWIFRQITEALSGNTEYQPDIGERREVALRHLELLLHFKGDYIGSREARRHMAYYMKGIYGSASARDSLNHAENGEAVRRIVMEFFERAEQAEL